MDFLAAYEKKKYQRMWTEVPGYRCTSPGEALVDHFTREMKPPTGDSIIDLGCGPGRASALLHMRGYSVFQLDITEASRDQEVRNMGLPFIEACLWALPDVMPKFDWVYCTDVLEHLPTEKVDAALDCMRAITGKGAFMQIALFAEGFGRHIGETLHLTVETPDWWQKKINQRWNVERYLIDAGRMVVLAGAPR